MNSTSTTKPVFHRLCASLHRHADAGDLEERDGYYAAGRMLRAADLVMRWARKTIRNGKLSPLIPMGNGCAERFYWLPLGREGQMELEQRDGKTGEETELQLSLLGARMRSLRWASRTLVVTARNIQQSGTGKRAVAQAAGETPALADGSTALVTTVYDLTLAN